jgi:sec-independent protein translocase protein TatA
MDLGPMELIIVFLVFLLLFGANKLPSLGEGLGKALRSFKDAMRGEGQGSSPATPREEQEREPRELPPARPSTPVTPAARTEEPVEKGGKSAG